jgi:hypothetical protein
LFASVDRLNLRRVLLRRSATVRRFRQRIRPVGNDSTGGATLHSIPDWRAASTRYVFLVAVARGPNCRARSPSGQKAIEPIQP